MRKFVFGPQLLLGTSNKGKIAELQRLLAPYEVILKTPADFKIAPPEETGKDLFENALLKAKAYGQASGLPVLADDAGLEIEALKGFPGSNTGRFAEEAGGYEKAFESLRQRLDPLGNYKAWMRCYLVFMLPEGSYSFFEGEVEGTLVFPPRGQDQGFGYDPIFIPKGEKLTFGEDKEIKNRLSHRAQAFQKFKYFIEEKPCL